MHAPDDPKTLLVVAPLLRPDLEKKDKPLYESIGKKFDIEPLLVLRDKDSYMQVANNNQFVYLELVPLGKNFMRHYRKVQ